MKKLILLSLLAVIFPIFQACERQDWKETKMFHDVPKRDGGKSGHHAPAAPEVEKK